jgi:hypothetical protein
VGNSLAEHLVSSRSKWESSIRIYLRETDRGHQRLIASAHDCPITGFGISRAEPLGSATRGSVNQPASKEVY